MKVRLATLEDSDDVLSWRNDSVTRSMSFETAYVDKESHNKWFLDTLENPNQVLVIGYQRSTKVGIVRFALQKNCIGISINMNAEMRGKGLAPNLLVESEEFIRGKKGCKTLIAEIKEENLASVKTFTKAGYKFSFKEKRHAGIVNIYKKKLIHSQPKLK